MGHQSIGFRSLSYLTAILIVTAGCAGTPQPPAQTPVQPPDQLSATPSAGEWPTQAWQTSSPEEQDIDPGQLDEMLTAIEDKSIRLNSILVIRHGVIVSENYFGSTEQTTRRELYSVTKSFTSTLVGIALDQGLLSSIDQPALDFFTDRSIENIDEHKQAMTIENVLTMTPGVSWEEGDAAYTQMYRSSDWAKYVLDMPMEFQPGEQFEYNSGASHVLSDIVQQVTGMNTADFAQATLFEPLGITDVRWDTDSGGISIGGWGLKLAPREMAKLGFLFLHRGEWDGRQIVSSDWVKAATQKHVSTDGDLGYGYQWWIDTGADAYMALGRYGQTIYVKPDLDLVVVVTAQEDDHDRILNLIDTYILPACSE